MADFQTYRVLKPFNWNGVELRPGDTWLVDMSDERAARVTALIDRRYATGDATLPSGDEAARDPELMRQVPTVPVGR